MNVSRILAHSVSRVVLLGGLGAVALASPAMAAIDLGGPVTVPNDCATGAGGATITLTNALREDAQAFISAGSPHLQINNSYRVIKAGIMTKVNPRAAPASAARLSSR